MLLTIIESYPSKENIYANGFVHMRQKKYIEFGVDSKVFLLCKEKKHDYIYEGVQVICGNSKDLIEYINNEKDVETVFVHFVSSKIISTLKNVKRSIKIVIFVHGNEALMWYERLFKDRIVDLITLLKFIKYIVVNSLTILNIRKYFKHVSNKVEIVTVSEWMKEKTSINWKVNKDIIKVIPNVIDEDTFKFRNIDEEKLCNILIIKNYSNGKYCCDIIEKIIIKMSCRNDFNKYCFTIIGDGILFDKYTRKIKKYDNVKIHKGFINHKEIAQIHKENAILLCPTRQDAQGVSMCEGMSSGLIPITSNSSAIPEYIPKEYNYLLCNNDNILEFIDNIVNVSSDYKKYKKMSKNVSNFIRNLCSSEKTIKREIELINNEK